MKSMMHLLRGANFRSLWLLALALVMSGLAQAQTTSDWTSITPGPYNWFDAGNWSAGVPDTDTERAEFNRTAATKLEGITDVTIGSDLTVGRIAARTISGISSTGRLNLLGAGTITLTDSTGSNKASIIRDSGGSNGSALLSIDNNIILDDANGVTFHTPASAVINGIISGSSPVEKTGNASLILGGNNTFTSNVDLIAGYLLGTTTNAFSGASSGTYRFAGIGQGLGIGTYATGTTEFQNDIVLTGSSSLIFFAPNGTGSTLEITTSSITDQGTSASGAIRLNEKAFAENGYGITQTPGHGTVKFSGTDFTINRNVVGFSTAFNLELAPADGTQHWTGVISGTTPSARIIKSGAGSVVLSGDNTSLAGVVVNAGTLQIGNGGTSGAVAGAITNNAALVFNRSDALSHTTAISGTGSLTKQGGGKLTLTNTNTYSGPTTVAAGELTVNGSVTASTVTVQGGATVGGSGTLRSLDVTSGGTVAPGDASPGTLTVSNNAVWQAGGNYAWEIHDATGSAGTGWDSLAITGTLDLTALSSGNRFNINLASLLELPNTPGNAIHFNSAQTYTWTIATASGGINGYTGTDQFTVNAAGFTNALTDGWGFRVVRSGNALNLEYACEVCVSGITLSGSPPKNAESVDFIISFTQPVVGVDASDFTLTATGTANATIGSVDASGSPKSEWTVPITGITGTGSLRLDLNASGTGIQNADNVDIAGGYSEGVVHEVDRDAPTISSVTGPTDGYYRMGGILILPSPLVKTCKPSVVHRVFL